MPAQHVTDQPRRWASLEQAADYLGVSRKTIRRHIARGEITGWRSPGKHLIRVDLNEIDALMAPIPAVATDR